MSDSVYSGLSKVIWIKHILPCHNSGVGWWHHLILIWGQVCIEMYWIDTVSSLCGNIVTPYLYDFLLMLTEKWLQHRTFNKCYIWSILNQTHSRYLFTFKGLVNRSAWRGLCQWSQSLHLRAIFSFALFRNQWVRYISCDSCLSLGEFDTAVTRNGFMSHLILQIVMQVVLTKFSNTIFFIKGSKRLT